MKKYYFYEQEISNYGVNNGYVDYYTLARSFNAVLCNNIAELFYSKHGFEPELINGTDYDEENNYYKNIHQYYIIDEEGCDILTQYTNEIVYYIAALDIFIWGVTHCGTHWSRVLTDIPLEKCVCYDE